VYWLIFIIAHIAKPPSPFEIYLFIFTDRELFRATESFFAELAELADLTDL
jgi:hypothetical protein